MPFPAPGPRQTDIPLAACVILIARKYDLTIKTPFVQPVVFSFCTIPGHPSRQRERLQVPFRPLVEVPERNESRTERKGGASFRSFRASETPPRQFLSIPFGVRIFVRVIQSVADSDVFP